VIDTIIVLIVLWLIILLARVVRWRD